MLRFIIIPILLEIPIFADLIYLLYKGIKTKQMFNIIFPIVALLTVLLLSLIYFYIASNL